MAKEFDWKKEISTQLAEQFPGVEMKWDGDNNPTLVIPDELIVQSKTIIDFVSVLYAEMGGEVEFHPDQATHTT